MFGLLSAVAVGAGLGYAKRTVAQLREDEKRNRDNARELARMNRAYVKELGSLRVLHVLLKRPVNDDVRAELQTKYARHELRARILAGQISELSVPVVYPV